MGQTLFKVLEILDSIKQKKVSVFKELGAYVLWLVSSVTQ